MDHPVSVGVCQSFGDLKAEFYNLRQRQRPRPGPRTQRPTRQIFQDQDRRAIALANFVDGRDIGMVECGNRARLGQRAIAGLGRFQ